MLLSWLHYGYTTATRWLHFGYMKCQLFFVTHFKSLITTSIKKRPLKQQPLQESFIYPKGRTSDEKMSSSGRRPLSIFILTIGLGLLDIL